ncbi:hypothetical protein L593_09750 [Salinarchaeum sp. Harcht-Bsk1]|nr:hypothetical protein [Salinarchaeum sp. Harcht-Bsk1]AGN01895.1 hypothetical protein L593_09750 [Salinarchaeum sp. Harcht-Bsk1]
MVHSPRIEHSDGQPGNFKLYRAYHEKLRRHDGWYCFVVYRPTRSGLTVITDRVQQAADLPHSNAMGR